MTYGDVASGVQLPMYICPFLDCAYHSNDRATSLHHVACGVSDRAHLNIFEAVYKDDLPWMTRLDYVYGAIAIAERERWPLLGLSITRRSLNALCLRYNDEKIECLACFICCQQRTTSEGFAAVDLENPITDTTLRQHEICMRSCSSFYSWRWIDPGLC